MNNKPILLITPTLINGMNWCLTAPNTYRKDKSGVTWKESAFEDLDYTLLRKPWIQNEAAERGSKFEDQVYKYANMPETELRGSEIFKSIVSEVRGGVFQKFVTKDYPKENFTIRIYGILDVYKPQMIMDIKTTAKFKKDKYGGIQDEIYRLLTGIYKFKYLIAEWDEYPKIKNLHTVSVENKSMTELEDSVLNQSLEFIEWLKTMNRYELYEQCYCHKGLGWKSEIAKKGPMQEKTLEEFYRPFWDKYELDNKREEF